MPEINETLSIIKARLSVIESKLDQLLKRFGFDDETLWDIHHDTFVLARKRDEEPDSIE